MTPRTLVFGCPILIALLAIRAAALAQETKRPDAILATYDVADLLVTREEKQTGKESAKAGTQPTHEQLINLIVKTVHPGSWDAVGGIGTVQFFPISGSLLISQSEEVHEEIRALLSALRRLGGRTKARPETKEPRLVTYPVADLVVPITEQNLDTSAKMNHSREPVKTIEDELIKLIRTSIAPQTWNENGGAGTMQFFPLGMSLVVHQRQEVHEEISALLAALRRLQDVEVAVEIKVVRVSGKTLKACKVPGCTKDAVAFLGDTEVRGLFDKLSEDPHFNVVQAPKLTTANGQAVNLHIGEESSYLHDVKVTSEAGKIVIEPKNEVVKTGWTWRVLPVVSADRRYVRLGLDLTFRNLEGSVATVPVTVPVVHKQADGADNKLPLTLLVQRPNVVTRRIERTLSILDGKTALLHGGRVSPPEAADVYEIVLVTPRILFREEEERVFEAAVPRP